MRVQKARYEPVRIAFDTLDQPVIRIEQAPFLAGERLRWREFLSSLYGEISFRRITLALAGAFPLRPNREVF